MAEGKTQLLLSLTKYGHESILRQGVFNTFTKFSITDDGNRYDLEAEADLSTKVSGGLRTLVTLVPTCGNASSKPINKKKPTTEESKKVNEQLSWDISRLDDCTTTYTSSNAKIVVNLKTWFNYLQSLEGPENYNYEDRLQLSLIDNVRATEKILNPSTYNYDKLSSFDNLEISYRMDSEESLNNYKGLNSNIVVIENGSKVVSTSTNQKFWSPMYLVSDTEQGQAGSGDNWKMSLGVISWGYVGLTTDSKETTFRKTNFYSINEIESMSRDEINEKFKSLRPAAITSKTNSNNDVYVLEDLVGTYSEGVDMLPTYTQRYVNSNGEYLSTGLVNKSVKFIKTNFVQSKTTPGFYEKKIKMRVNNKVVNNTEFGEKNTVGGTIEIILQWDDSSTNTDYDSIVTWI